MSLSSHNERSTPMPPISTSRLRRRRRTADRDQHVARCARKRPMANPAAGLRGRRRIRASHEALRRHGCRNRGGHRIGYKRRHHRYCRCQHRPLQSRARRSARDGSAPMTGITRFGLCAATVAALSAAASGGAQAFSFNETVFVHPIVHNTFVMGVTHDDHWTCGIFSYFNTNGLIPVSAAPVLLKPFNDRIAVGYDYFMDPGTQPCACQSYGLVQMRGGVSFRTLDIPDNFLVATLVLTPLHAAQFGATLNPSLLNGLYQTSGKTVTFSEPAAPPFIH